MYWQAIWANEKPTWLQPNSENERQQSVSDFACCILYNPWAVRWHVSIMKVLAYVIGIMVNSNVAPLTN
jgi:hypothetical protein